MKKILLSIIALYLCSGASISLPAQDTAQGMQGHGIMPPPQPGGGTAQAPAHPAANPVSAKPAGHFPAHVITGNNMQIAILAAINPTIDGRPLQKGDEIAAFSSDGQCVGVTKWRGSPKNVALCVWGANPQTPSLGGMKVGDSVHYRIWDSTHHLEAMATATYNLKPPAISGGAYMIDGISFLASLTGISAPQKPIRLLSPGDSATVAADSAAFLWTRGLSGTDRYIVEAAGDSTFSSPVFSDTLVDTAATCARKLHPGATYWWWVWGHTGESWSECTPAKQFIAAP